MRTRRQTDGVRYWKLASTLARGDVLADGGEVTMVVVEDGRTVAEVDWTLQRWWPQQQMVEVLE